MQGPWQNGLAERWIGSCRREKLDHVIALNEEHLRRLLRDYVNYHEQDRLPDALAKETPNRSAVEQRPGTNHRHFTSAAGWVAPSLCVAPSRVSGEAPFYEGAEAVATAKRRAACFKFG